MSLTDTEDTRIRTIESKLNELQVANSNLASRKEVKNLLALLNKDVEDLTLNVEQIELTGSGSALANHKINPDAHLELNTRFILRNELADSSTGVPDAGKPVKLNSLGLIDGSMIGDISIPDTITLTNLTQVTNRSHSDLQNLTADDHPQYLHLNKASQTILQSISVSSGITIDGRDISVDGSTLDSLGTTVSTINSNYLKKDGSVALTSAWAADNRIYHSTAALNLGTAASTGHSLTTGDVLLGNALEVDGATYLDSTTRVAGIVSLASTSGLKLFRTADETTDTEYLELNWNAGTTAYIQTNKTNSGTSRGIGMQQANTAIGFNINTAGTFSLQGTAGLLTHASNNQTLTIRGTHNTTTSAYAVNLAVAAITGTTMSAASGQQSIAGITGTINQSGTANYRGLVVDVTEGSIGSGTNLLLDLNVGSSSKFSVTSAGNVRTLQLSLSGYNTPPGYAFTNAAAASKATTTGLGYLFTDNGGGDTRDTVTLVANAISYFSITRGAAIATTMSLTGGQAIQVGIGNSSAMQINTDGTINYTGQSLKAWIFQQQTAQRDVRLIGTGTASGHYTCRIGTSATAAAGGNAAQLLQIGLDMDGTPVGLFEFKGDSTFQQNSAGTIVWSSTTDPTATPDIGLKRSAAGVLQVTDGSSGSGQLLATSIIANNAITSASVVDDVVAFDNNGIVGGSRTTDVAPQSLLIRPQAAFAGGTQAAADLLLLGGQDETKIDIDDYTQGAVNDTVTIICVDNTGTVTATIFLVAASASALHFVAQTDNATTASNLAACINTAAIGVTATASSAQVRLALKATTAKVNLAESRAAFTTVSHGTQGLVKFPIGTGGGYLAITAQTAGGAQPSTGFILGPALGVNGVAALANVSGATPVGWAMSSLLMTSAAGSINIGQWLTTGIVYNNATAGTLTAGTMSAGNYSLRTGWTAFTWTNAMVTALGATTTGEVTICTLPAKTLVKRCFIRIATQAGGVTTLSVSVGRTGTPGTPGGFIDYVTISDAKVAADTIYGDLAAEVGTNLKGSADATALWDDLPSFTATTALKAQFTSTIDNLSVTTGCTGVVYLQTELLP